MKHALSGFVGLALLVSSCGGEAARELGVHEGRGTDAATSSGGATTGSGGSTNSGDTAGSDASGASGGSAGSGGSWANVRAPASGGALAGASGGANAAEGGDGEAGPLATSPGTTTLEVTLTGYDPRCWAACPQPPSIAVEDASGNQLALDHVCDTDCETCAPSSCPTGWCVFGASPVKKLAWDGGYYATSTCGSGTECAKRVFAPPGKYKALFCTSPTVFTGSDGGKADCITLTSLICVTADFDFPSATPVTATLPQGV